MDVNGAALASMVSLEAARPGELERILAPSGAIQQVEDTGMASATQLTAARSACVALATPVSPCPTPHAAWSHPRIRPSSSVQTIDVRRSR